MGAGVGLVLLWGPGRCLCGPPPLVEAEQTPGSTGWLCYCKTHTVVHTVMRWYRKAAFKQIHVDLPRPAGAPHADVIVLLFTHSGEQEAPRRLDLMSENQI